MVELVMVAVVVVAVVEEEGLEATERKRVELTYNDH